MNNLGKTKNALPETAVRIRPDGSQERISIAKCRIGDVVVLDESNNEPVRIVTERRLLGEISSGRFQFVRASNRWCDAMRYGDSIYYRDVYPASYPFGKTRKRGYLETGYAHLEINAITFEVIKTTSA